MWSVCVLATTMGSSPAPADAPPCTFTLSVPNTTYDPMEGIPLSLTLANTGGTTLGFIVVDTELGELSIDLARSDGKKASLTAFGRTATVRRVIGGLDVAQLAGAELQVRPGQQLTVVLAHINRMYDMTEGDEYTVGARIRVYELPKRARGWEVRSNPVNVEVRKKGLWTSEADALRIEAERPRGR